jgi:hypothetical protein
VPVVRAAIQGPEAPAVVAGQSASSSVLSMDV